MLNSAGEMPEPLKVMHIIGGLPRGGGAEEILFRLVKENTRNKHVVVSLQGLDDYGVDLEDLGITVVPLNMKKNLLAVLVLPRLVRVIRQFDPHVIQTWMYYSDLLGGICGFLAGKRNIVWGIHHSTMDSSGSSFSSRVFMRLCAVGSYLLPSAIISCSDTGAQVHVCAGYSSRKMAVVHNGYDLSQFFGMQRCRGSSSESMSATGSQSSTNVITRDESGSSVRLLRDVYSINSEVFVLGMIARYDPQKDHRNLISALSMLRESGIDRWVCLLFGTGMDESNSEVVEMISEAGLTEWVVLGGLSTTIAADVRQLDLVVLSSRYGEAFPNVLNEAMASEVPCVATNVGDSRIIVGDNGWIVPPSDPAGFSQAIQEAVTEHAKEPMRWENRRKACRRHIADNFSISHMADAYEAIWRSGIKSPRL